MSLYDFQVDRTQLSTQRLIETQAADLAEGQIRLEIERFALTANNITYGVAGDMLGYWTFFPAEENWGRIPVWGIAKVAESKCSNVAAGDRFYGYYPMSSELIVIPEKVSARGFTDASAHRQALSPVYNQYSFMTSENGFPAAEDNHQILYRPLFSTAFVIDDFFADNNFFGVDRIILSSASSKTAFSTAFMLKLSNKVKITGLTSAGNLAFVESLGLYDEVIKYEDIQSLDTSEKVAYVDMAGNRDVLSQIHHHFKEQLCYSCGVGITHWDARDGEDPGTLPGAKPSMFFAPTQMQKRNKEWGPELFQQKLSEAWKIFVSEVDNWVEIVEHETPQELEETFNTILKGAKPNKGTVLVSP